ncbi:MAG: SH3 domain-containing protein [Clostridiaceae bacterium]|nr:SH3 domain-containing protein [Clostridiaceae bacterium]
MDKKTLYYVAILLLVINYSLFAITDVEVEMILCNESFYGNSMMIVFKKKQQNIDYLVFCNEYEASELLNEGTTKIENGTLLLQLQNKQVQLAFNKADNSLFYSYELKSESNDYHFTAGFVQNGKKGLYNGVPCTKQTSIVKSNREAFLYIRPQIDSPLDISNKVFMTGIPNHTNYYYTYPNCCRIHPGEILHIYAIKEGKETIQGEAGHWYLVHRSEDYWIIEESSDANYDFNFPIDANYVWVFLSDKDYSPAYRIDWDKVSTKSLIDVDFLKSIISHGAIPWPEERLIEYGDPHKVPRDLILWFKDKFYWPKLQKRTETIIVGNTVTLIDNLRLRENDTLDSDVIHTLKKGSTVNIRSIGSQDVIDNIYSYWLQVEVQKNAKDKDGKFIKAGTLGYCFGGYLK